MPAADYSIDIDAIDEVTHGQLRLGVRLIYPR